jgi:hypothetical protein
VSSHRAFFESAILPPSEMGSLMKKIYIAVAVALVLLFAGYVAAGPYLALDGIREGIVAQDQDTLEKHIDFPVLRDSMKQQLAAAMTARLAEKSAESGLGDAAEAMGALFASKMVEVMVDKIVTPAGLAMMTSAEAARNEGLTKDNVLDDLDVSYEGLNRVVVTQGGNPDAKLVLTRQGLSWRLTGVQLPTSEVAE